MRYKQDRQLARPASQTSCHTQDIRIRFTVLKYRQIFCIFAEARIATSDYRAVFQILHNKAYVDIQISDFIKIY